MVAASVATGSVMLTWPVTIGPTMSFSRYVSGACMRPPGSAAASTAVALADPVATRFVPSSGSTAMSTDVRRLRVADLLADVEHRRLVALALADDDRAGHLGVVHGLAHGGDGGLVGAHRGRRGP